MGNVTESDNRQDKDIATTITRVDGLERRVDRLEETSENLALAAGEQAKAAAAQAKSIGFLEKIMYGILLMALGALVKVIIGVV